jgi:hypothetical protein
MISLAGAVIKDKECRAKLLEAAVIVLDAIKEKWKEEQYTEFEMMLLLYQRLGAGPRGRERRNR